MAPGVTSFFCPSGRLRPKAGLGGSVLSAGLLYAAVAFALAPSLLAAELPDAAQEVEVERSAVMEEVLVTGSRLSASTNQSDAFVLEAERLQAQLPVSVIEALNYAPGVYVSQPGGRGGVASLSIRGAESNFAVVQVDGVQVNDPTNTRGGSFDFSTIDINDVHRIDVVRGAASAIYGSDALAGVINIITFDRNVQERSLSALFGEDSLAQGGLRVTTALDEHSVAHVALSAIEDDNPAADSMFSSVNGRLALDRAWGNQFATLVLSAASSEAEGFPEDSGGREFAVNRALDERSADALTAAASYRNQLSQTKTLHAQASHYRREDDYTSIGIAGGPRNPFGVPANGADSEFERTQLQGYLQSAGRSLDVAAGIQWQQEKGVSDGEVAFIGPTFFSLTRDTFGAFIEGAAHPYDPLRVELGVRADKIDGESLEVTYRLRGEATLFEELSVFAAAGRAFKAPSFFALANPLVGNPELKPETVRSYELGVRWLPEADVEIELAGFVSRYKNLIDFDPALFTNLNRGEVNMSGWDLSLSGHALSGRLNYQGFFSYVDVDLKPTGRLRQRPQWRWGASVAVQASANTQLVLNWQHNDERFDSSIPNPSVILDEYQRLDAALHWQATQAVRLSVAADNLFDERYSDADGFVANGRRLRVGARWAF